MRFSPQGGNGTVFALRGEPNRSPAERVRFGKEEGANIVQFSPQGGNGTVIALRENQIEAQRSGFDLERKKELT